MRVSERVLRLWKRGEPMWSIRRRTGMSEEYVRRVIRDYERAEQAAAASLTPHLQ